MDSRARLDIDIRKMFLEIIHDYEYKSLEQRRKVVDIALKEVIEQAPNVLSLPKDQVLDAFKQLCRKEIDIVNEKCRISFENKTEIKYN